MSEQSDLSLTFRYAKHVTATLVVASTLLYLASGFYVVESEQRGVVTRFGKIIKDNVTPGMHYHWPWPIETVKRPRTTAVRSLSVPFRYASQIKGQEAGGERNRRLPKARADAESILRDAEAYAKEVVEKSEGDSRRFLSIWEEYSMAKNITAYRLYFEAVENIMPRVKKLIINPAAED